MKLHYLKGIFILCFFSLTFLNVSGQIQYIEETTELVTLKEEISQDWVSYFENEVIKVEYKMVHCDPEVGYDNETIYLKISNQSNQEIEFNWHTDLYYNDQCRTCVDDYEHMAVYNIPANGFVMGDCNTNVKGLKMFVRFIDPEYTKGAVLTKFQLKNMWYELLD